MPLEAAHLDRLFRLEREGNLVGPVRQELAALKIRLQPGSPALSAPGPLALAPPHAQPDGTPPAHAGQLAAAATAKRNAYKLVGFRGCEAEPKPCLMVQVREPLHCWFLIRRPSLFLLIILSDSKLFVLLAPHAAPGCSTCLLCKWSHASRDLPVHCLALACLSLLFLPFCWVLPYCCASGPLPVH